MLHPMEKEVYRCILICAVTSLYVIFTIDHIPFVCLSLPVSVCLSVCLSVYLSVCFSICLLVHTGGLSCDFTRGRRRRRRRRRKNGQQQGSASYRRVGVQVTGINSMVSVYSSSRSTYRIFTKQVRCVRSLTSLTVLHVVLLSAAGLTVEGNGDLE